MINLLRARARTGLSVTGRSVAISGDDLRYRRRDEWGVKVECPQWVESGHWRVPAKEVFERVAGEALEGSMDDSAIEILDTQRTMAISTLRPDGWPQTTIVGYVNEDLTR